MKWKTLLAAAAAVCALALLTGGIFLFRNPYRFGFSSPEKAVEAYVKNLKKGNVERCVQISAPDVFASHFNAEIYYSDYLGGFYRVNGDYFVIPTDTKVSEALMTERQREQITAMIENQYSFLLLRDTKFSEDNPKGSSHVSVREEGAGREYVRAVSRDPGISELELISVDDRVERYFTKNNEESRKAYQKMLALREEMFGAKEIRNLCAELEIGGERYVLFLETANFGGRWYVAGPGKARLFMNWSYTFPEGLSPKEALG